jgi:hypothetical protein
MVAIRVAKESTAHLTTMTVPLQKFIPLERVDWIVVNASVVCQPLARRRLWMLVLCFLQMGADVAALATSRIRGSVGALVVVNVALLLAAALGAFGALRLSAMFVLVHAMATLLLVAVQLGIGFFDLFTEDFLALRLALMWSIVVDFCAAVCSCAFLSALNRRANEWTVELEKRRDACLIAASSEPDFDDADSASPLPSPSESPRSGGAGAGAVISGSGSTECVVCMSNARESLLSPCNHLVACLSCAQTIFASARPQCPMCRARITKITKVFL